MPVDLLLVAGAMVLSFGVLLLPPGHPVRVVGVLPVLLLVPGYLGTLAVFPAGERPPRGRPATGERTGTGNRPAGLDLVERLALSFGLSVVLLPVFAMGLAALGLGYTAPNVLGAVTTFAVPVAGIGVVRRSRTHPAIRYEPTGSAVGGLLAGVRRQEPIDGVLNAVLLVVAISAMASLGLAIVAPQDGSAYTTVNLLTEDLDGELSAANYPTELTRGETGEVVLAVTNHEGEPVAYEVVVQLQRVGPDGAVDERTELDRFRRRVAPGVAWHVRHEFRVQRLGDDLRVVYLVYRDGAPTAPTVESAYRSVYLWVDVEPVGEGTQRLDHP